MNAAERAIAATGVAVVVTLFAMPSVAAPDLAGTVWVSREPDCEIRQLKFDADIVVMRMAWNAASANWTLTGSRLDLDPVAWDAKLAGELKGDAELQLTFDWTTTDYARHRGQCRFSRKP